MYDTVYYWDPYRRCPAHPTVPALSKGRLYLSRPVPTVRSYVRGAVR